MLVHVRARRPRADFATLERDVDRIFRSSWSDREVPSRSASFGFEVTPDKDGITVRAEVPGVEPSAIAVGVDGRTLTISGERTNAERSEGTYHLRERHSGTFSHTFHLSDDLDPEAITAECRNGVLTLHVAKRPEAKPRQIEVKTS